MIRRDNLNRLCKARGWSPVDLHRAMGDAGGNYSFWPQILKDPKKAFGEKLARKIEDKLALPRGWLDLAGAEVPRIVQGVALAEGSASALAQSMSQLNPILLPHITWESAMRGDTLPELFALAVNDDALGSKLRAGTVVIWSTTKVPKVGSPVLVRDSSGCLHVRLLAEGDRLGHYRAEARVQGYRTLDSVEHGLQILAVFHGRLGDFDDF